jgi:transcriptional regulator with XRE-family HTH domain
MPKKGPYLRRQEHRLRLREKTNFVREWRETKGWTQEELAAESGLSVSSISAYERLTIDGNDPSVEALRKLGKALGVPGGMILDIDPTQDPTLWSAFQRATPDQRRDMGRAFDAMVGPQKRKK